MDEGITRLNYISNNEAQGDSYTHAISFKDQLADNLSEDHDFMWYLGAGDLPNFKAIEICKKVIFNLPKPSIVSFEVHHSPIKQNSFLCTQLLPRRLEAISASIYRHEVLLKLEEYSSNWPHIESAVAAFMQGAENHILISSIEHDASVYVDPGNNWGERKISVELERVGLYLGSSMSPRVSWEFTYFEIGYIFMHIKKYPKLAMHFLSDLNIRLLRNSWN
jgi:hypothetical protein